MLFNRCFGTLKTGFQKLLDRVIGGHSRVVIILMYNTVGLFTIGTFYLLVPIAMGYSPRFRQINAGSVAGYNRQFLTAGIFYILCSTAILGYVLRHIKDWTRFIDKDHCDGAQRERMVERCYNLPYFIYTGQLAAAVLCIAVLFLLVSTIRTVPYVVALKLSAISLGGASVAAILSYIFSKSIFTRILIRINNYSINPGKNINLGIKIFGVMVALFIAGIIITASLGYARLIEDKGDVLYEVAREKLTVAACTKPGFGDSGALLDALKEISVGGSRATAFVVDEKDEILTSDKRALSYHLKYYLDDPVNGDRLYGDTLETQGVVKQLPVGGTVLRAGIIYEVASDKTIFYYIVALVVLSAVSIIVMYYFSHLIAKDIRLVSTKLMDLAEGKVQGNRRKIVITSNDELGLLVSAFNQIQEKEIEYDKIKNEFFANISHEFRTPLNIILSSIQLYELYLKDTGSAGRIANVEKTAGVMRQNCYRLLRLINNLIDTTKIEASFYKTEMRNHNIVDLVEGITQSVVSYARGRDISLSFDTQEEELITAYDADMLERVMLNLLSNAIKFTNPGGEINVNVANLGEYIQISVADTGIGIEPEHLSHIFERFRQVDKTLTRKSEGSGIGLSLVKSLVEMQGGKVQVKSEPGKGTQFDVLLRNVRIQSSEEEGESWNPLLAGKLESGIEKISIEFSDIYDIK